MRTEAFVPIAERLSRNLSYPGVAGELAEALVRQCGAAACRIWLAGPGDRCHNCPLIDECRDRTECLHLSACHGCDVGADGSLPRYPVGARAFGQVAATRAPFVCHHPGGDHRLSDGAALSAARIQCCTAWPLVCDEKALGVLVLYSHEELSDTDLQQVSLLARRAAQAIASAREAEGLRRRIAQLEQCQQVLTRELLSARFHEQVLGMSAAARELRERLSFLAGRHEPVLICGPIGSGKELAARAMHAHGTRRSEPFVRVDCRSVPEERLESELFGQVGAGAAVRSTGGTPVPQAGGTPVPQSGGAAVTQAGIFEMAGGGVLFLKHVDRLSDSLQGRILEAVRSGRASRLGSETAYPVRVRLLASARTLPENPSPLLFHLAQLLLTVPPLTQRIDDIPLLVEHNIRRYARLYDKGAMQHDTSEDARLQGYHWPGNVRELMQLCERAVLLAAGGVARMGALGEPAGSGAAAEPVMARLEEVERAHIVRVLRQTAGVIQGPAGAAALLGLRPSTLRSRMARLGIPRRP
jgi:transcriptional regulator with GAF, ATPase, and Fis domain